MTCATAMPESKKATALSERLVRLGIRAEDVLEKFVKGSGKGGQKINKTSSTVYLKHLPSGIEVKSQASRSQALNRYYARCLLADAIERRVLGRLAEEEARIARIRRQKRRRSRRAQEKMLVDKHHQGERKKTRARPSTDE